MSPHDVWVANGRCPAIGPKTKAWCMGRAFHEHHHYTFVMDPRQDESWPLSIIEGIEALEHALADQLDNERYGGAVT